MNTFAAFLSIFLLCLAILPCSDASESETEQIIMADNHDHEGEADSCVPLCYCHCCHVHVTINASKKPFTNTSILHKQLMYYLFFTPETPSVSLFRPPIV